MSAGYASRLSNYPNKGKVGLPESSDTRRLLSIKLKHLTQELRASSYTVVLTGAGISTASGIPDFRGPNGIWTKEKEGKRVETKKSRNRKRKHSVSFESFGTEEEEELEENMFARAKPTLTHRAITKLMLDGRINYCITQNVDGLHRRSGLSRSYHSTVHGCVFTEKCANCGSEYFGDEELGGLSFKPTGNHCDDCGNNGLLHDTLLDWEDPVLDIERVSAECEKADLVLCLGTSLRIEPVGSLPLRAKKIIIVNLQVTPKDEMASFVIRAKVDDVMETLMRNLGYNNEWEGEPLPSLERKWKPDANQNKEWALLVSEFVKRSL
mmetsp:Transcript_26920/g.63230  ORF Transcript_26920/g.63230 Transcript_26920/m.63230 type:complete len:324 (+) Transcript_26920:109-1080(+)